MSGKIIYEPNKHKCDTPEIHHHVRGTIWRGDCGHHWRHDGDEWVYMSPLAMSLWYYFHQSSLPVLKESNKS